MTMRDEKVINLATGVWNGSRLLTNYIKSVIFEYIRANKMTIERNENNIIITLDASLVGIETVQKWADYFRLIESNAKNQGTQEQADELARESHQNWLKENQYRLSSL